MRSSRPVVSVCHTQACCRLRSAIADLVDELIAGQPRANAGQVRTALASQSFQRMAVPAILVLKHQGPLQLSRRHFVYQVFRNWVARPRIHDRRPGGRISFIGKHSERRPNYDDGEHSDGSFAGKPRSRAPGNDRHQQQTGDQNDGKDQDNERLQARGAAPTNLGLVDASVSNLIWDAAPGLDWLAAPGQFPELAEFFATRVWCSRRPAPAI